MKKRSHSYSESFTEYLQKKYAIMSAGIFLVVMMIAAPFLGSSGIASLIGQDTTTQPTTSETMPSSDMPVDSTIDAEWEGGDFEIFQREGEGTSIDSGTMDSGSFEDMDPAMDENWDENLLEGTCKGQGDEGETFEGNWDESCDETWEEDMHEAAPESGGDMGSESDNIQWDGSVEEQWNDSEDMNQPEEDWQEPERQEKVCGQDSKTYNSEDEAISAGTDVQYYGECGKASAREIRDMERQMKNWKDFDFPRLIKDSERSAKDIGKIISRIKKYSAKAEKKGIDGGFIAYADEQVAALETDVAAVAEVKKMAEEYSALSKTYIEELKNRLALVKSGERGSQYYWDYTSRLDPFWLIREMVERRIEPYRNMGYYDFIREFVKQRFEAATQGVLDVVDWSGQDTIREHFTTQRAQMADLIKGLDAVREEAVALIKDTSLSREDFESERRDLWDEKDSITYDFEDIWEADRDFWDSEPWREMDKIWQEIQWARESSSALKELENMMADVKAAREVIDMAIGIYEEKEAIAAWESLAELIDEKVLPAAEKTKEKAEETHNPEIIWHFFDRVMDPLTRYIEPKIGYLADLFYAKYADTVSAEEYTVLKDFFDNAPRRDPMVMIEEFDFEDEDMKMNLMGKIDQNLAAQIVEKIISNVSSEMLENLSTYDKQIGDINLKNILDTAAFSNNDGFVKLLEEKEKMLSQIVALQDEMKELRKENQALSSKLKDIAKYNFYGVEDFQEKIAQIDVENMTDEKLAELEKEAEQAKEQSREAKFKDGINPFRDTDDDQWFTKFVSMAKEEGIVSGKKDSAGNLTGNYDPGSNVTNAEFAKMLLKGAGENEASGEPGNEKARGHWAQGFFRQAENRGLELAWLAPDESANRCTVAKSIVQLKGYDLAQYNGEFSDVSASDACAAYIATVKREGIMSGDSNGTTFRPYETLNRAEVAKVISKLMEQGEGEAMESFDVQDFMKDISKMKAVENNMTMPESTEEDKENIKIEEFEEEFMEEEMEDEEVGFVEKLKMAFSAIGSLF